MLNRTFTMILINIIIITQIKRKKNILMSITIGNMNNTIVIISFTIISQKIMIIQIMGLNLNH